MMQRKGRWIWNLVVAALLSTAALALLYHALPLQARPLLQESCTYEIATTPDSAVTMGDMVATLSFVITNTGDDTCNGPIDHVELGFDPAVYV